VGPEGHTALTHATFLRLWIDGCREASLAREGKQLRRLRMPFYGVAARLRFTQPRPREASFTYFLTLPEAEQSDGHGDQLPQGSLCRNCIDRHKKGRQIVGAPTTPAFCKAFAIVCGFGRLQNR